MSGRIPDDIVLRIKSESDLVSIISDFVALKKSGKDYKGVCPFHQEKTPSFFVVPSKEFYHCFGCGKGGNVVNFIMDIERLEYPEALRYLAQKAGITIPTTSSGGSNSERIYNALKFAADFYQQNLYSTNNGKKALEYLNNRGIEQQTIKKFRIGYAPDSWDGLLKAASAEKIQSVILEKSGLVKRKEGLYDRFRNRIVIPINNLSEKTIAFGARLMPGNDGPKYINSPETEVYKKGRVLYGFDITKHSVREENEAVVVEGYFDLIALYQSGIANVVASSGTGFTPEQASLLARFCEKVVLMYDPDSAGVKAAFRACGIIYNAGLEPRLIRLPKGLDPDSFVREKGADSLSEYISNSDDIFDFVIKGIKGKISDQTVSMQKKIISKINELIEPIDDNQTRAIIYEKIYSKLGVDMKSFAMGGQKKSFRGDNKIDKIFVTRDKFEKSFLSLIISHPELYPACGEIVDSSLFAESENADIFELIGKIHLSGREITVSNLFDEVGLNGLRNKLSEIAFIDQSSTGSEAMFEEFLNKFKKISKKKRLDELKGRIIEADRSSDRKKLERLTREFHKLETEV